MRNLLGKLQLAVEMVTTQLIDTNQLTSPISIIILRCRSQSTESHRKMCPSKYYEVQGNIYHRFSQYNIFVSIETNLAFLDFEISQCLIG